MTTNAAGAIMSQDVDATRRIELVGIDGAGKTSLAAALGEALSADVRKVGPFDDQFQNDARSVRTLGERTVEHLKALAICRALLLEAAHPVRRLTVYDRYVEAARMYSAVKGLPFQIEELVPHLPQADFVVFLDIDPELSLRRRLRPAEETVELELAFEQACAHYFRTHLQENWIRIDASRSFNAVLASAVQEMDIRLQCAV